LKYGLTPFNDIVRTIYNTTKMNKILILSFTFSLLFLTNLSGQKQKSIFSFPKIEKLDLTTEQSKSLSKHTRNENFLDIPLFNSSEQKHMTK